ncbi:MAG: sugar phosphate isomerase/epimerase family protein [Candidatus Heimdallarchaeota archaeon]
MVKYAYNTLVYTGTELSGEPLKKGIERISRYGYDGVEIVGEPEKIDTKEVRRLLKKYDLEASSICSIYTRERDLVSSNEKVRKNAVKYVKDVARMAFELGASVIIVAPSACTKVYPEAPFEKEWDWAVENIRKAAQYAADLGVKLAIEPWNRYETYFINRLEQALDLRNDVNLKNVGVMGDLFHMSIEEASLADAILKVGKNLIHLHIADTNRAAPGRGHLDFKPIVKALKTINYKHYLSMELLPAAADPFAAMKVRKCDEFFDLYTEESIEYLKKLWLSSEYSSTPSC